MNSNGVKLCLYKCMWNLWLYCCDVAVTCLP